MDEKVEEKEGTQTSMPLIMSKRLAMDFFNVPCFNLANFLLGKILTRHIDGELIRGRIVETECYLGGEDRASHSFNNRRTPANEPMYMQPGIAYVYMTYGMYHCFNISSQGDGAAVLLRALEPLTGIEKMRALRSGHRKVPRRGKPLKDHELCNGPSKLCISLNITKQQCNKTDLCTWDGMWIEEDALSDQQFHVVQTSRIGIDSVGGEWARKPLRFYVLGNACVSRRDKDAEQAFNTTEEDIKGSHIPTTKKKRI